MQNLDTLNNLGNKIQILVLIFIFLSFLLQVTKYLIDRRVKYLSSIIVHEQKKKVSIIESKLTRINSIEIILSFDIPTEETAISQITTKVCPKFEAKLFYPITDGTERLWFVSETNYQTEQLSPNIKRLNFKLRPKESFDIIGQNISKLENFLIFDANFSGIIDEGIILKSNIKHYANFIVILNKVEVINFKYIITSESMYKHRLTYGVNKLFENIVEKYHNAIAN